MFESKRQRVAERTENVRRNFWRRSLPVALLTSVGSALTLGLSAPAQAQSDRTKSDLFINRKIASHASHGWSSVIVRIKGDCSPQHISQLRALGADIYRRLPIVNSIAVRLPSRNLAKLAALPFVQHLSSDLATRKNDEFTVKGSGADVAFQQTGLTGGNIGVAVVDSGVGQTQDLTTYTALLKGNGPSGGNNQSGWNGPSNRIVAGINFAPDQQGKVDPNATDDECGHGTHVSGIIAGDGVLSTGLFYYRTFYGVARQANLINVRVLDENGAGTVSQVIAGLQWIVNNKSKYNIRVVNLSLGHPVGESYTTDPLCQAVEQVWKSGIVVVCAAGNAGRIQNTTDPTLDNEGYGTAYGSIQSPGNDPYVLTVGAMKAESLVIKSDGTVQYDRTHDRIATYSSRGPSRLDLVLKPDIVAPGNRIISVDANNSTLDDVAGNTNNIRRNEYQWTPSNSWSNSYFRLSGTSMAAPVVSGAAALMLQNDPTLTPDTIKARLMIAADKWTQSDGSVNPCTFGAGYVDIPAALKCTVTATQSALSPVLSADSQGNVYISMDSTIWGTRAIWGTGIYDLRAIWGDRAIWGTSANILNASRALWGTSVWNDRAIWGTDSSAVDLSSIAFTGEN